MKKTVVVFLAFICATTIFPFFNGIIAEDQVAEDTWRSVVYCGMNYVRIDTWMNFVPEKTVNFYAELKKIPFNGENQELVKIVKVATFDPTEMLSIKSKVIYDLSSYNAYDCRVYSDDADVNALIDEKYTKTKFWTRMAFARNTPYVSKAIITSPEPNDILVVGETIKVAWTNENFYPEDEFEIILSRQCIHYNECANFASHSISLGKIKANELSFETKLTKDMLKEMDDGNFYNTNTDFFYTIRISAICVVNGFNVGGSINQEYTFSIIDFDEPMCHWPKEP